MEREREYASCMPLKNTVQLREAMRSSRKHFHLKKTLQERKHFDGRTNVLRAVYLVHYLESETWKIRTRIVGTIKSFKAIPPESKHGSCLQH